MMTRIKRWICEKYLPVYAREGVETELSRLRHKVDELEQENACLRAYIDGFERGAAKLRRIIINTGEGK